jgi:DNA (cytosine-5)-methyltransferase 1
MKINHLDLFSGIGGFHLGFERAGYEITSYFSEIDKHAVAVYKHQFPTSTYVGSVTDVRGADLPNINLITFGSPCQDFSLAGKRKGMEGQRSSLVLEAIRLISECRPSVFVWENVKGTFSSNDGADFWAIIQAFTDIGGYRLEWQLLNTSWFLPQNRERIYLVGYSTEPSGRGVFPIGESNNLSNAMTRERQTGACITTSYHKGVNYDNQIIKVKSATSSGYEEATSGDTINLSQPNSETRRGRVGKQKAQTLETSCNQAVVQPVAMKLERTEVGKRNRKENRQKDGKDYSSFQDRRLTPSDKPISNTITSFVEKDALIAVVQPNYTYEKVNETIRRNNFVEGEIKAMDLYNKTLRDESPALTQPEHNGISLFDGYRIRRLTPIECERLQGFQDQHTAFGNYDGEVKPMSNSQRYKQLGNAVTVDVVAAVAKKCIPLFN